MRSIRRAVVSLLVLLPLAGVALPATAAETPTLDVPYQKFVLDNGLTLLVHEDHKAPIVAVNVWYHVGSKNEKPGRTGFAHLFEHIMFNGSENFDDDYFRGVESAGATDMNGTTNNDRTNYFQNVPTSALDRVLFLESDRMGHLLGALTQEKLDEQRGVVQNEKRQYENQPYSVADELITKATYPPEHPYSWTVIGSMDDLDAASLDDVKEWFRTYYGAANAVVVVAGDVDAAAAEAKVEEYFGDIPPGPPVARHEAWIAKRTGTHRASVQDRVPQSRVYMVWNVPQWGTEALDRLDLLSDVLATGKSSRLYKRLVYDDRIATGVSASLDDREIGSLFTIEATAAPGGDLAKVEAAIREELAKLLAEGPTVAEVERARNRAIASFVRGAERIGGFGGKSDILARCQVWAGDPGCYRDQLAHYRQATPAALKTVADEWLSDGVYVLDVVPYPEMQAAAEGVDRSSLPEPGEAPAPQFPALQHATLGNGLEVVLAERHAVPVVRLDLLVDSGYASDPADRQGTASFAMEVLDEGTESKDALAISDELARLGATLATGADLDTASVSMAAMKPDLDESLALFADVALHPAFPQAEIDRLKAQRLAQIQREKVQPVSIALRVMPPLIYGPGHAYATPFTGSGTEAAVQAMTRDDLARFHGTWFKPNNATLIVVGDITLAEIRPKLERLFAGWKRGDVPARQIAQVPGAERSAVYLIDRPGSIQSVILAGELVPPRDNPDEQPIQAAAEVLGGGFVSRLNMNLREDKHWAYGAGGFVIDTAAQRPIIYFAPVQSDQTGPAMKEMLAELQGIVGDHPVTDAELDRVRKDKILSLPGSWETSNEVGNAIEELVRYDLPDSYWADYPAKIESLDLPGVRRAAGSIIHPGKLVWVVVGDRSQVEQQIRDAGFTDVQLLDADGKPVAQ